MSSAKEMEGNLNFVLARYFNPIFISKTVKSGLSENELSNWKQKFTGSRPGPAL